MVNLLDPQIVRMPALEPGDWLNSEPISKQALRGRVALVDFWDYTCINCLRTLPYLRSWHGRYADKGLTIIGIHTPEFKFARLRDQLEAALTTHDIRYPILLDNDYKLWDQFANKAWPTKYLVDTKGYIRLRRQGEGYYQEMEQAIQQLLQQRDPDVHLPALMPPVREEDAPGAVCYRPMPEIYAGYQGGGLFGGGLGNADGYMPHMAVLYALPERSARERGRFYLDGVWRAWPEAVAFAGQDGGQLVLPYTAVSVNAVLAPSADEVELALKIRPSTTQPIVEVQQDGRYLAEHQAGKDVRFTTDGISYVEVTRPRLYHLVENLDYESHEITLTFRASGMALYSFTFTTCVAPDGKQDSARTYQVK